MGAQTHTNDTEPKDNAANPDDSLKPISAEDLMEPTGALQETSARREWRIKRLQEELDVSREIAEKMVDEGSGSS